MTHPKPTGPQEEQLRLTLSPKDPAQGDPGIVEKMIAELREELPGLLVSLPRSGSRWLRGKSEQEVARAREILANAIDRIGRLALDEQDQRHRHTMERANAETDQLAKQVDLYLSALERATRIVKALTEMGIDVDITQVLSPVQEQLRVSIAPLGATGSLPASAEAGNSGEA